MTSPMEGGPRSELQLTPERMEELAALASRLIIDRLEGLPDEPAWMGGSRTELEAIMREDAPEEGRPPEPRGHREVSPEDLHHPNTFPCPGIGSAGLQPTVRDRNRP